MRASRPDVCRSFDRIGLEIRVRLARRGVRVRLVPAMGGCGRPLRIRTVACWSTGPRVCLQRGEMLIYYQHLGFDEKNDMYLTLREKHANRHREPPPGPLHPEIGILKRRLMQ